MQKLFSRWFKGLSLVVLAMVAIGALSAFTLHNSALSNTAKNAGAPPDSSFKFSMVPSPNIPGCLPYASASVTIVKGSVNDTLTISVTGLAPSAGYDLFIIELPNKPFGIAWYQSDLQTNSSGAGSVSVRGIFDVETFSVSLGDGSNITFPPTHQYHVGLWFDDPNVPFKLGCEPGQKQPIITPFNGTQHAGVQVLNTSNFPDNAGPLSHLK